MIFFALRNHVSHQVEKIDPTKIQLPNIKMDKETLMREAKLSTFNHYFISSFEGTLPNVRVDSTNPPVKIHNFLVDYDSFIDDNMVATYKKRVKGEHLPSWIVRTRGGGVRLVFEFEQPILYYNEKVMKKFYAIATEALKLKKIFPGLDPAWCRHYEYFDIGVSWTKLDDYKIPSHCLHYWLYQASNTVDWNYGENFIPLDEIYKEIQRRFPGRWKGEFVEGARGIRFWDANADNPTAVVVRKNGLQCFTGTVPFISWSTLLGKDFIEKYREQSIGRIVSNIYYDGVDYYRKTEEGWRSYDKSDLRLFLKTQYQISSRTREGEEASDLDRVINYINEHNRVDYAVPLVHFKDGVLELFGNKYLNIYNNKVLQPEGDIKEWGRNFPFISAYLENLFVSIDQLEAFLSWLKIFYEGAFTFKPRQGQVLVVSGGVGVGKTLLATKIVAPLVGGVADGTAFVLGETAFTASALSKPLILIDDAEPAENIHKYQKYTTMLKKLVANKALLYNQKFQKACNVVWIGRVMVLCNQDVVSLGVVPSLDVSTSDKMLFLKAVNQHLDFAFPDQYKLDETLTEELPYFASYLLNFNIPENLRDENSRYGIKCVLDEDLKSAAINNSPASAFFEMLIIWRREIVDLYPEKREWRGSSTDLLISMGNIEKLEPLVNKLSSQFIGRALAQLSSRGFPCNLERRGDKREWVIWWDDNGFPQEQDYEEQKLDTKNEDDGTFKLNG